MSIFSTVFIALPNKTIDEKNQIHNDMVTTINTFCKDIVFDIWWKYCELVTCINTFYKKTVIPKLHELTDYAYRNDVLLIKDGIETSCFKNWTDLHNSIEEFDYDLILYTNYSLNDDKKNYTIIINDRSIRVKQPNEKMSSVNFIVFQLTTNNTKYDISLKEPKNFLLQNNVLKYPFFKWYMKTVYQVELSEEFSVNYMTQDMSTAEVYSPFFIKFGEDSITCFSSAKPKQSIETCNNKIINSGSESGPESGPESGSESGPESGPESGSNDEYDSNFDNLSNQESCNENDRLMNNIINCEKLKAQSNSNK
jgi:hypothetical protein